MEIPIGSTKGNYCYWRNQSSSCALSASVGSLRDEGGGIEPSSSSVADVTANPFASSVVDSMTPAFAPAPVWQRAQYDVSRVWASLSEIIEGTGGRVGSGV